MSCDFLRYFLFFEITSGETKGAESNFQGERAIKFFLYTKYNDSYTYVHTLHTIYIPYMHTYKEISANKSFEI